MKQDHLQASLIIPTHNRLKLLARGLESLARQTCAPGSFEVIVVADNCQDGTVEMLRTWQAPFDIQMLELDGGGPAAARNLGAEAARGRLLIFLDDDIEVEPEFINAHLGAHNGSDDRVIIGYLPPALADQQGYFRAALAGWWEAMFNRMRSPEHRFCYTDLLSGNFSLTAELFHQVGGFNSKFRCHEDYELGLRLHKAGATFAFVPQAAGYHFDTTDIQRAMERKYAEGQADVALGHLYPELAETLLITRLERYALWPSRLMRWLAFSAPGVGDILARKMELILEALESMHALRTWQRGLDGLMGYWYWRGVTAEFNSTASWRRFYAEMQAAAQERPVDHLEIDLALGLEAAEMLLDERRPDGVTIFYAGTRVGSLRPEPGAEKLSRKAPAAPVWQARLAYLC